MSRRAFLSLAIASSAVIATAGTALAQQGTGIRLDIADWLEPWDETGGWIAVPAGRVLSAKSGELTTEVTADLEPGSYDVYWDQNDVVDPLPVATNVVVSAGAYTDVPVNTGALLSPASWVPRTESGWFGAILSTANSFDFVNFTFDGNSLYLPPGDYSFYYQYDDSTDAPPVFLGDLNIEAPFGGLGIEVSVIEDEVTIVRPLPGTGAEAAGVVADDIILAVDDTELTGLALEDAVAAMRGAPGTEAVLTIKRGKETIEIVVQRTTVEPLRIIEVDNGLVLTTEAGAIGPDGWWGVVYAGVEVSGLDDLTTWRRAGDATPMVLGPFTYDIYWNRDGQGEPEPIATDVTMDGTLMEIDASGSAAGK